MARPLRTLSVSIESLAVFGATLFVLSIVVGLVPVIIR